MPPRLARLAAAVAVLGAAGCGPERPQAPPYVLAPAGHQAPLAAGAFLPLHTGGARILDAEGRQVILRGLEMHPLQDVDYGGRRVLPGDDARIVSWGFTVVRFAISWSKIEPAPGRFDAAYLQKIQAALDTAERAGLAVILEWHQDLWGRCAETPGSALSHAANGAPNWTCPEGFVPSTFGHQALFDRLWHDDGGLEGAFVAAWTKVIRAVGDSPALLGYDLINEPGGTGGTPTVEKTLVYPAYRKIVPELRAAGAKGLIFLDAPELRNETPKLYTERLDDIGKDLVFAPHLYSGWTILYVFHQRVPTDTMVADVAAAKSQAKALGLPLWDGEWGVNLNLPGSLDDLETHEALEEEALIGSSYWSFSEIAPDPADPEDAGAQALLDAHHEPRPKVLAILSRPYPIETPGTLTGIHYDPAARALTVKLVLDPSVRAPMVLYAPPRIFGAHVCLAVDGGAWSYRSAGVGGDRILVRLPGTGARTVHLTACEKGAFP